MENVISLPSACKGAYVGMKIVAVALMLSAF